VTIPALKPSMQASPITPPEIVRCQQFGTVLELLLHSYLYISPGGVSYILDRRHDQNGFS